MFAQWPAVSTTSGAISVPVHEPVGPRMATASGHFPGGTIVPPITGCAITPARAGALIPASRVSTVGTARRRIALHQQPLSHPRKLSQLRLQPGGVAW